MSRQWKPGDVAMVYGEHGSNYAMWSGWHWQVAGRSVGKISGVRPVVLLDPENREQVADVFDRFYQSGMGMPGSESTAVTGADWRGLNVLQRALRSLVADPKPEEPTSLGVVVRDQNDDRWIAIGYAKWIHEHSREIRDWADIDVKDVPA